MRGYENYKSSKFLWFDKLPENWIEGKIKYLFEISRGRVISQLELKPEAIYPVYSSQTKNDGCLGHIETFDYEGEMLTWTTDGANAGSVFQRKGQFNCTNVCGILIPKQELNLRYYFYYVDFITQFYKRPDTNGAKIMSNEMAEIHCFIPSTEEQTTIASFLDYKTNLIDATIEKKKRLMELLKEKRQAVINEAVTKGLNANAPMKDSGVEWLGDIPEHWEVMKLKHIADISFSSVDRHEYNDELKVFICHYPDAYKNDKINNQTVVSSGTCTNLEYEKYQLKKGQVIITKDSESANDIGVPTYVEETIENAVCGYHLAILEPQNTKIQGEFLFRFIQTSNVAIYFENNSNGVTRFGLGKPKIENLYVVLPSIEEQSTIIEYINYQSELIDKSVSKIKLVIEKLQTYRQSLISEAVTGKIDVRDWEKGKN